LHLLATSVAIYQCATKNDCDGTACVIQLVTRVQGGS